MFLFHININIFENCIYVRHIHILLVSYRRLDSREDRGFEIQWIPHVLSEAQFVHCWRFQMSESSGAEVAITLSLDIKPLTTILFSIALWRRHSDFTVSNYFGRVFKGYLYVREIMCENRMGRLVQRDISGLPQESILDPTYKRDRFPLGVNVMCYSDKTLEKKLSW